MKKLLFLFGLLFFAYSVILPQTWTQQSSGTTNILNSVCFVDENHGWVVGDAYPVNEPTILRTTDGGLNWTKNLTVSPYRLLSVYFINELIGWAVGDGGIILKTNDGGINWFQQTSGIWQSLSSVFFINDQIGWAAGAKLLKTLDGGNNWIAQDEGFTKIQFINSLVGFGVLNYGVIKKTIDGGQTWVTLNTNTTNDFYDLYFHSTELGLVIGRSQGNPMVKTTDGGQSWVNIINQPNYNYYGIDFVDQNNGWAVGGFSGNGRIINTTDGGNSWELQHTIALLYLNDVNFPNSNNGWAVGYGGTILKCSGNNSSPSITITAPNGGENVTVGSTQSITWTSVNVSNVMIEYTIDNGNSWFSLGSSYPAASGSFSVVVPNTPSTQCKVKITDVSNTSIYDISDDVFTISSGGSSGGLIAYYPFNGNTNDESGNGRHGVNYGATLTSDRFGNPDKAYQFNGSSSYIDIPGTNNLHLNSTGLTLAAWINFTEPYNIHAIVGKHVSGYGNGYYIMTRPATLIEFLVDSDYGLRSSESYNDGNWHFIVGTFDESTMMLYIDGELKSSQNKNYSSLNDSTITIGKHHAGVASDFFDGKIDDIRIFDKAISEAEVQQLYNDGINLNNGLVAYYPFNGNVNDESGNGRNGVNFGATLTTDRFGIANSSYNFNGTSNYINIPGTNNLHLNSGGFSLTSWINFIEPNELHAIVSKHISGYGNGYYLMVRPATKIEFYTDSEYGLQGSDSYNDGNWHFLAGVYDGSTMKLYIDGLLKATQLKTYTSLNDSTLLIGKHHAGVTHCFFNGKIDDIRVYNRPLTELELFALYNDKTVSVEEERVKPSNSFILMQNYPNPFNPNTTIKYGIPEQSYVKIEIFNMLGQSVGVLVNQEKSAGYYETTWKATNLPSGIYIISIITEGVNSGQSFSQVKKMLLLK